MGKQLTGIDEIADVELTKWGEAVSADETARIAWSRRNVIKRVMDQGANGASQAGAFYESLSDEVRAIDRAVAAIEKAQHRRCLIEYYAPRDKRRKQNQSICAEAMGVPYRTFKRRLRAARRDVAAIMGWKE